MGIFGHKKTQKKSGEIKVIGEAGSNKLETYILSKAEYKNANSPNLFVLGKAGAGKSFHLIIGQIASGKSISR